jgi:hypothetical protein
MITDEELIAAVRAALCRKAEEIRDPALRTDDERSIAFAVPALPSPAEPRPHRRLVGTGVAVLTIGAALLGRSAISPDEGPAISAATATVRVPAPTPPTASLPASLPDGFALSSWSERAGVGGENGSLDVFGAGHLLEAPYLGIWSTGDATYPGPGDDAERVDVNGVSGGLTVDAASGRHAVTFAIGDTVVSVAGLGVDDDVLLATARRVTVDAASHRASIDAAPPGLAALALDVRVDQSASFTRTLTYRSSDASVTMTDLQGPAQTIESLLWGSPRASVVTFAGHDAALVAGASTTDIDLPTADGWLRVHVTGDGLEAAEELVSSMTKVSQPELVAALDEVPTDTDLSGSAPSPAPGTMSPIARDELGGRTYAAFAWRATLHDEDVVCIGFEGGTGCGVSPLPTGTVFHVEGGHLGETAGLWLQVSADVETIAVDYEGRATRLLTPVEPAVIGRRLGLVLQTDENVVTAIRLLDGEGEELARLPGPLTTESLDASG